MRQLPFLSKNILYIVNLLLKASVIVSIAWHFLVYSVVVFSCFSRYKGTYVLSCKTFYITISCILDNFEYTTFVERGEQITQRCANNTLLLLFTNISVMFGNRKKRWPTRMTDRLLIASFCLLLTTITWLPKRALRYQFDKRGYKLSNVNNVVLYLKEIRWK